MVQMIESEPNRVAELFANKTLFVTGATGFVGKVLIEKLLRSCTGLRKIYVLVRSKKGKSPEERFREIFNGPLYDLVKKQHGKSVLDKVEVIPGDAEAPGLGISGEDRKKLTEETEIIYHSAATVQFDEPFKKTVLLNVRGTKLMLALAKECTKLLAYCHVSTAYCQENQDILYERVYPPPSNPHHIIETCEWMKEDTLEVIAEKIRGWSANNYTFTKALGEGLVSEQMDRLPVVIVRPSAVIPILYEPLPGWTDNVYGPMGLLLGAGKGAIRTMYGRSDYFLDYVPVDATANALIATVYDYVTNRNRRVYNITSGDEVKVTFQEILDMGRSIVTDQYPFDVTLWYPGGGITTNRLVHYFRFVAFQLVPAIFIDIILFLLGYKPFMVRVQKKIFRGYKMFEYYANREWNFVKDQSEVARNLLNDKEKEVFKIDAKNVDVRAYFADCTLGARRYLMKDKDENIPKALRRMKALKYLDRFCKFMFVVGILYFLFKRLIVPLF